MAKFQQYLTEEEEMKPNKQQLKNQYKLAVKDYEKKVAALEPYVEKLADIEVAILGHCNGEEIMEIFHNMANKHFRG
jgi:uncharacterized protein YeeX (DUF496 family)